MPLNEIFAVAGFALVSLSLVPEIAGFFRKVPGSGSLSTILLLAAGLALMTTIVIRGIEAGFPMIANTYEVLVFFSAALCLVAATFRIVTKTISDPLSYSLFGCSLLAFILLAVSSAPILPKTVTPPIPPLHSYWLVLHVGTVFVGEAFFALSFVAAILYLLEKDEGRRTEFDRLMYRAVTIGFPIFTAGGLIFASIWAEYAWGSYWSWDPKETWSLITWLVYAALLHSRLFLKKSGRTSAIFCIAGFAFTVFTFAGVNFLLTGLHSYAA